jgi:hypothetical protein
VPPVDEARAEDPPPAAPARAEFIMSGSLTPLANSGGGGDLPGVLPGPMPGFLHRLEVRRLLQRWRNGLSLVGRVLSSQTDGPWDHSQRFEQPNHLLSIK